MLRELHIHNLLLVPECHLHFKAGFTTLTGETGAGKSVLLSSLKLLAGEKPGTRMIGPFAEELRIEGSFDIPVQSELISLLEQEGLPSLGTEIVLERILTVSGKSRCRVNGSLSSASVLELCASFLMDLHGQHHQQKLLHVSNHLEILDTYGKLQNLSENVKQAYFAWQKSSDMRKTLIEQYKSILEQKEFLQYQVEEFQKAKLKSGEEEELEEKIIWLTQGSKVADEVQKLSQQLEGEKGILSQLRRVEQSLENLRKYQPGAWPHSLNFAELSDPLKDLHTRVQNWEAPAHADPALLDSYHTRLALYQRLRQKYSVPTTEALLALAQQKVSQFKSLADHSYQLAQADERVREDFNQFEVLAKQLHERRLEVSSSFTSSIQTHLSGLDLAQAKLLCTWTALKGDALNNLSLSPAGLYKLEFFFSANPGMAPESLHKTASGGEISRLMLGIKAALAGQDSVPLMVFDEIDTGLGGETASKVAECMDKLSKHHQLLVITHLPQIAARSRHQFCVQKSVSGGQTQVSVNALTYAEREIEISRMLGKADSKTALNHAREILAPYQN